MKLSVVILNYNLYHFLHLCVDSVTRATAQMDAEIIVIDNASTDGSREGITSSFPEVIWIQNDMNLGFAKANNKAVALAQGEYLCILNPDTVVAEDTFETLLAFVKDKDNLGAVGCRLIDGRGLFLPESKRNAITFKIALNKLIGISTKYYKTKVSEFDIDEIDVLVGAFMFLRRSSYESIGGFDEDFFMYGEDIDFSMRLQNSGLKNYYFGNAPIIHFKGESALKDDAYRKNFFGAMTIYYHKHFKRNLFRDLIVGLGGFLIQVFSKNTTSEPEILKPIVLISKDSSDTRLIGSLPILKSQSEILFNDSEVCYVVDMSQYSYREVITAMSSRDHTISNQVKFTPNKARFAVGSNSANTLGSAIIFETI